MSKGKIRLRKRRVFSAEFKRSRIKEYESGEFTVQELSKMFNIDRVTLYRWIHTFSTYNKKSTVIVEMKDSAAQKLKDYEKRIADLERALGQKQLSIDYLEKVIDLAKERYDIDLKKNSDTPPLIGSEKTKR